ncbi:MAG: Hsp20/alpha crystallin family protein [Planctomycetota bacterium]|jgi:HSP20 family protein
MATDTLEKPADNAIVERKGTHGQRYYRPNVDLIETANELTLLVDVPRVKSDDIDIHFENGTLTIHGKVHEEKRDGVDHLLHEYGIGDFYRTFQVSERIDADGIVGECADGVLTLHLPNVEAVKPRKLAVKGA